MTSIPHPTIPARSRRARRSARRCARRCASLPAGVLPGMRLPGMRLPGMLLLGAMLLGAVLPGVVLPGSALHAQTRHDDEYPLRERDLGRPQMFGIGGGINFGLYSGDVDVKEVFPNASLPWRAGAEASALLRLAWLDPWCSFHLRFMEGYHPLRANSDTYSFVNYTNATSLSLQIEFFLTSPMRVYLFAGGGYMKFRLTTEVKEPDLLEKQHAVKGTSTGTQIYPVGIGLIWYMGRHADAYYQFAKMLTTSDNLDGWEANIRDNFQVISIGLMFYF